LGFSAKDAKLWSHRSGERAINEVNNRYDVIQAMRTRDRTYPQQQYLNKVRATRNERDRIVLAKSDRVAQWAKWSNRFGDGFPAYVERTVAQLNDAEGLPAFDNHGFRAFWYFYVEGEDMTDLSPEDLRSESEKRAS
jgi:hypothetical protein